MRGDTGLPRVPSGGEPDGESHDRSTNPPLREDDAFLCLARVISSQESLSVRNVIEIIGAGVPRLQPRGWPADAQ
jgi:hypothetical protein